MASIREEVALERSFQCKRLIHRDGDISTRDLAERMQISNGAAYYVLNALIEKGYVKAENFKDNPKKSGYLYLLTSDGWREKSRLTAEFIQRKRAEYEETGISELESLELTYVEHYITVSVRDYVTYFKARTNMEPDKAPNAEISEIQFVSRGLACEIVVPEQKKYILENS